MKHQRMYVNVDHVATLRQARGGVDPDPVAAAAACERAGAEGITAHLREDRRHINDEDIVRLSRTVTTVLNLEMACTEDMLGVAERVKPYQATLVPERRMELTTEGGLEVRRGADRIREGIARLRAAGIRSSLFIDPDPAAVEIAASLGAAAVELHTGRYANAPADPRPLAAIADAAQRGVRAGLAVHAGHGLSIGNVRPVAAIEEIEELNIGHSVVARALFVGLAEAVRELRRAMDEARSGT